MNPGQLCTVHNGGDLYFEVESRPFIGQRCHIVKQTKGGPWLVSLESDPKKQYAVAASNITVLTQSAAEVEAPVGRLKLMDWQIESTCDELFDKAQETGNRFNESKKANGRPIAHAAYQACTAYHAIEAIRQLQKRVLDLEAELDEIHSYAEDRRFE